ncbi:MAG: hypothetical protein SFY32_07035 [Bacteroidota bacterium]|nr:hypothetical protein [Bacteroidota bacterium]
MPINKLLLSSIILIILIQLLIFNFVYPISPLDLGYYLSKSLETHLFYKKNGLQIQWWSPAFGGGLPSFPNPQQTQFSFIQLFLFLVNPWIAICLDIAIFSFVGFFGAFILFFRICKFEINNSIVFAALFIFSGFQIQHLIVGHQFFQLFVLLPLIIYFAFHPKFLISVCTNALIITYFIYNAGFYPLFACMLSAPISMIIINVLFVREGSDKLLLKSLLKLSLSVFFALLIGASKISGMMHLMRFFERDLQFFYGQSFWECLFFVFNQLFLIQGLGLFANIQMINSWLGNGMHEKDVSISPVFFLLFVYWVYSYHVKNKKFKFTLNKINQNIIGLVLFIALIIISFSISTTYGIIYPFLKSLPIIKSFSSVIRFTVIFVLPLILFLSYLIENSKINFGKISTIVLISLASVIYTVTYVKSSIYYSNDTPNYIFRFNPDELTSIWEKIQKDPNSINVDSLVNLKDPLPMIQNSSSAYFNDPIFWSNMDKVHPKVEIGTVGKIENGCYNMTNPASLVFPEENNLKMWDRISVKDKENFERFRNYKTTNWKLPLIQILANWVSAFTLICTILLLFLTNKRF